jgi:orotate phosphoribosyltransferase
MKESPRRKNLLTELARVLVKSKALEFGTFTLSSGKTSSYYIDLRIVPSFPGAFKICIDCYSDVFQNEVKGLRTICGIPTAGIPYASVLAYLMGKPLIYARRKSKDHGTSKMVEGLLEPGDRVVVLDDVITTGQSILSAVNSVRLHGGVVEDVVVLIDRLEGGEGNLARNGVTLHRFTTINELTDILVDLMILGEDEARAIKTQVGKTS